MFINQEWILVAFLVVVSNVVHNLAQEVVLVDGPSYGQSNLKKFWQKTLLDSPKSMEDLVVPQGYPIIKYEVVTEDGYILGLFRIPYGRNETDHPRESVILQHGLFASSSCYVMTSPEKGLGFILADAGFDVWLPNTRGNFYSRKHVKLDPDKDQAAFYDFSFHEMGYYDMPAVIDFVLKEKNSSQVYYVGHSQGSTVFLVMTSTRPEYNAKIKSAALMAPAAFLGHEKGPAKVIADFTTELEWLLKWMHVYVVLNDSPLSQLVDKTVCLSLGLGEELCKDILFLLFGSDPQQFNKTLIPLLVDQGASGGASAKQLVHFGQLSTNNGKFSMFDYGRQENLRRYGEMTPPSYNLTKISVPIVFHYGLNDWLVAPQDVVKLNNQIPTSSMLQIPYSKFTHLDFLWAIDVKELVYNKMIALLLDH